MKKIFIKMTAVLLILAGSVSCAEESAKDANVREIPFDELPIEPVEDIPVNHTVDGIEFSFYLLNKKGEPATVFTEDENFAFYFKCTNNANKNFIINDAFLFHLIYDGFCRVISNQNDTIGYPFVKPETDADTVEACNDRLDWFPFYGENNSYKVIIPWNGSRKEYPDITCPYKKCRGKRLSAGKYYMEFNNHKFWFHEIIKGDDGLPVNFPVVYTVSFKIDFEIKEDVKKFGL